MRILPTPLALAAALACCPAQADISETFKPFISVGQTYDDNLLRLPENTPDGIQRPTAPHKRSPALRWTARLAARKLPVRRKSRA